MDAFLASLTAKDVSFGAFTIFFIIAVVKKWIIVGGDDRVKFLTEALATERARGDRLEAQNLKLMGYVEAAMGVPAVDSGHEGAA